MAKSLVEYYSTIGLNGTHPAYKTAKLIRVCFDVFDDDTVKVYAVSGHSLGHLKKIQNKTITRAELAELDDDPCNYVVFARAAFALLDISV